MLTPAPPGSLGPPCCGLVRPVRLPERLLQGRVRKRLRASLEGLSPRGLFPSLLPRGGPGVPWGGRRGQPCPFVSGQGEQQPAPWPGGRGSEGAGRVVPGWPAGGCRVLCGPWTQRRRVGQGWGAALRVTRAGGAAGGQLPGPGLVRGVHPRSLDRRPPSASPLPPFRGEPRGGAALSGCPPGPSPALPIPQGSHLPPSESVGSPGGQSPAGLNCPSQEGSGPQGWGTASALSPEATTGPRVRLCRPRQRTSSTLCWIFLESHRAPGPCGVSRSPQTWASQGLPP